MKLHSLALLLTLPALACQSTNSSARVVTPATEQQRAALIERIKTLEGTWETTVEGKTQVASVFSVSSNGSAVREIMFPGTPHEMTNMYTMDGDSLLMTHYCAIGNQPRMRARAGADANVIRFETDGVSNLQAADEGYMGALTMTIVDQDHVKANWVHFKDGKSVEGDASFELTRKR